MASNININYTETFKTTHSRDFYRGTSFHFSGKWEIGNHYVCDEYNTDFVSYDQVLLACKKSHLSKESNAPIEFVYDEEGNITGVVSEYWDFVLSNTKKIDNKTYKPHWDSDNGILSWEIVTETEEVEPFDFKSYILSLVGEGGEGGGTSNIDIYDNPTIQKLVVNVRGTEYFVDREESRIPDPPVITWEQDDDNHCTVTITSDDSIRYLVASCDASLGEEGLVFEPLTPFTGQEYSEPFELSASTEYESTLFGIQTIAVKNGRPSLMLKENITLSRKLGEITFHAFSGDEYSEERIIELRYDNSYSTIPEIAIWYSLDDGESVRLEGTFITLTESHTIKAQLVAPEWISYPITEEHYIVKQIRTPNLWTEPNDEYAISRTFYASCSTDGVEMWYTLDDSDPETSQTRFLYDSDFETRVLNSTTTVWLCAEKEGWETAKVKERFVVGKPYLRYGFSELAELHSIEDIDLLDGDKTIISIPTKEFEIIKPEDLQSGYIWICVPRNWMVSSIMAGLLPLPTTENVKRIGDYKCYRSYSTITKSGKFNII